MRSFGLTIDEIKEIKNLLEKHFGDLAGAKVYLFGSRAKGTHKKYSDIDLAIKTKEKDLSKRLALFTEDWEKTKVPYKSDITSWKDLFKPYLSEISKTKVPFWEPEEKMIHPWRICPYGQHWVKKHLRQPRKGHSQDVDGHCRKNSSGKDRLEGDEIESISRFLEFQKTLPAPSPYPGQDKKVRGNEFDVLITGWSRYWNEIFKPDELMDPNFVKALIESESMFNPAAIAKNKKTIGPARGLIQITEQSWRILKDPKGEIKDHFIILTKDELLEPNKNICAGIRWLFRKREILTKRLSRTPSWPEVIVEYKGLGPGLKKNDSKSQEIIKKFNQIYERYK